MCRGGRIGCVAATGLAVCLLLSACSGTEIPSAPDPPPGDAWTREADSMEMVYVPGGSFRMGRPWRREARAHRVTFGGYWIDSIEVTNVQYERCVTEGACPAPTTCSWGEPTFADPLMVAHPAVCVTWQEAADYCAWAGARLPTEAEWEYAARGPAVPVYPWGDELRGDLVNSCDVHCSHSDMRVTTFDDGYGRTSPSGAFPAGASWCGALDMAGNVWEWVADWYADYPTGAQSNPTGPDTGTERIIRGGSWFDNDEYGFLRSDNRHPFEPRASQDMVGFRCAVSRTGPSD